MCGTCGCSETGVIHLTPHDHAQEHDHQLIDIEQNLLEKNQHYADINRKLLAAKNTLTLNFVSSPGAGKTSLLEKTILDMQSQFSIAVIEGDQQTSLDAERIAKTGAPVVQINTGKSCHLDAHQVGHALEKLLVQDKGVVFIENVGNLICPALFDLGENYRIAIIAVTEGDDKPLKYPDIFASADLMIINKVDLLPYVIFDIKKCAEYARRINPAIEILELSVTQNKGLSLWYHWLTQQFTKTANNSVCVS